MSLYPRPPLSPNERNVPHTRVDDERQLEESYVSGDVLGKGSFGVVYEAVQKKSGQKFAIKVIHKEKPGSVAIMLLEREVEILKHLQHCHIIQLVEVFDSPKRMFLVLELCKGGELLALLKAKGYFTQEQTRQVMQQLIDAVVYMHDRDMVHRDLKLENILMTTADFGPDFNIKVTDFGLSNMKGIAGCDEQMMDSRCGTLFYMAPEVLKNKAEYSKLCDIWSIGVIMYTMLCGHVPFRDDRPAVLEDMICKGELKFADIQWLDIDETGKQLIRDMMKVDPAARVTARQVRDDGWITGDPAKGGGRIDVLRLMAELRRGDSEDSEQSDQPSTSGQPSSSDQPSTSDQPSSSNQTNMLAVPNGLPPIKESVSDKNVARKQSRSPSGTSRPPSGTSRPLPRSPNSASGKSKATPRPLAAIQKTDSRRASDSSVSKKPPGPPKAARPSSVSTSKIQGRSSSMGTKKTSQQY